MPARSVICPTSCVASSLLQKIVVFVLGQRDIATADDEDYNAHIFVCLVLEELKPLQSSAIIAVVRSWPCSTKSSQYRRT